MIRVGFLEMVTGKYLRWQKRDTPADTLQLYFYPTNQ